jgi:hypothetical protein
LKVEYLPVIKYYQLELVLQSRAVTPSGRKQLVAEEWKKLTNRPAGEI